MFTITLKAVRCFLRPELAAWGRGRVEANSRHRTRLHVYAVGEMQKQLHAMESIQLNVRGIPVEVVEIRPNHRRRQRIVGIAKCRQVTYTGARRRPDSANREILAGGASPDLAPPPHQSGTMCYGFVRN